MDTTLSIAILACIVVAAFLIFRSKAKVRLKGPSVGLEIDATNQPTTTPTPPTPASRSKTPSASGAALSPTTGRVGGVRATSRSAG